jgi:hypothetical protein
MLNGKFTMLITTVSEVTQDVPVTGSGVVINCATNTTCWPGTVVPGILSVGFAIVVLLIVLVGPDI